MLRNILIYLPWEFAHTGVHWVVCFSGQHAETPFWVWLLLNLPQLMVVGYFISIVITKGERCFYDYFSNTMTKVTDVFSEDL